MGRETIIWTALPNGIQPTRDGKKFLRLSVFVSPRLQAENPSENRLSFFPDFLNWTERMQAASFTVEFSNANTAVKTIPNLKSQVQLDGRDFALWKALFKPDTYVRSHSVDTYVNQRIASYPVSQVLDELRRRYQQIGVNHGTDLLNPELLQAGDQRGGVEGISNFNFSLKPKKEEDGEALNPLAPILSQFLSFHAEVPVNTKKPQLLSIQDLPTYIDFHQALASLSDYPYLLRRLGIIFDLQIAIADAPPVGAELRVKVIPNWQPENPDKNNPPIMPQTICNWDGNNFW